MSDPTIPAGMKAWPFNGHAPGNYVATCLRCNELVYGVDKRATSCLPCAVIAAKVTLSTPTTPDALSTEVQGAVAAFHETGGSWNVAEARAREVWRSTPHKPMCRRMATVQSLGAPYGECTCDHAIRAMLAFRPSEGERLREALEPFARLADDIDAAALDYLGVGIDELLPNKALPVGGEAVRDKCTVTIGALIAARAALKGER